MTALYSAFDLAGLPGMPSTDRGVRRWFEREHVELTKSQRGGLLCPVDVLPLDTRTHLTSNQVHAAGVDGRMLGSEKKREWQEASPQSRAKAVVRLGAITRFHQLCDAGMSKAESSERVRSELGVPPKSLRRWRKLVAGTPEDTWGALLLTQYKSTSSLTDVHPDAWQFFMSAYLRMSCPTWTASYDLLVQASQDKDWGTLPSCNSLKARLKKTVPPSTIRRAREGTESFEHNYPAQRRDKSVLHAGHSYNADGHTFDVFCLVPNIDPTKPPVRVRPVLMAVQDVYSAVIVGHRLDFTENTDAVRLAFSDAIRDYGIPYALYLDNGHAYNNKGMTGGLENRKRWRWQEKEPWGFYKSMDIEVHFAIPGHGQSKPIERSFRDLCDRIAKHPLCEGAYTGNRPTTKPENYGTHEVDWEEFSALVDLEIAAHNAREGRRSPIAQGRSFDQVWADSVAQPDTVLRRATEEQIQWSLLPVKGLKVGLDEACLTFLGNRFFAPALMQHQGETMVIRFDPYDVHAGLWVFKPQSLELLCKAECIQNSGFNSKDEARKHARGKKALRRAERDRQKALGLTPAHKLAEAVIPAPSKPPKRSNVVRGNFQPEAVVPKNQEHDAIKKGADAMRRRLGRRARSRSTN